MIRCSKPGLLNICTSLVRPGPWVAGRVGLGPGPCRAIVQTLATGIHNSDNRRRMVIQLLTYYNMCVCQHIQAIDSP